MGKFLTGLVLAAGSSKRLFQYPQSGSSSSTDLATPAPELSYQDQPKESINFIPGQPKQLLPFRGTTLLGWTLAQAEASPELDEVLVILGHASDAILASVALGRARPVLNPEFGEGCAASYRTGLAAADPRAEGVMILLSDQPGVDVEAIGRVAASWRAEGGRIVIASYQGVPGHPLLFDRQLFPDLAALHGDKAAWKLIDQHPDWVRAIEIGRTLPKDVDTWADYSALSQ